MQFAADTMPVSYSRDTGAVLLVMQTAPVNVSWAHAILKTCPLILVSDGLPASFDASLCELEEAGCVLMRHAVPLGLGRGMKTAIHKYLSLFPEGRGAVLCSSETGFNPHDLPAMLKALEDHPDGISLGIAPTEGFSKRILADYSLCRMLFKVVCGKNISDVRAQLRAIPMEMLKRAAVLDGEDEGYLLNQLLTLSRRDAPIYEVPITHRENSEPIPPVLWVKLLSTVFTFIFSSLASGIVDYGIFLFMHISVTSNLAACQVTARIISSAVNFTLNKTLAFKAEGGKKNTINMLVKYYLLVAICLGVSTGLLYLVSDVLPIPAAIGKLIVEAFMYFINYFIQRDIVFRTRLPKK